MTDEQKAQALALAQIPYIGRAIQDAHPIGTRIAAPAPSWIAWAPDLADQTGAVEGVLHRVLVRLVGEPVHLAPVWGDGELVGWLAERAHSRHRLHADIHHPTQLAAIVAALLALPQGTGR